MNKARKPVVLDLPTRLTRRRRNTRTFVVAFFGALALVIALGIAKFANDRVRVAPPGLHVAPLIVATPSVETPLPIQVSDVAGLSSRAWLRIGALPPDVQVAGGRAVAPGTWDVPVAGLGQARLAAASPVATPFEIEFKLMASEGTVLAQKRSVLVIATAAEVLANLEKVAQPARVPEPAICPPLPTLVSACRPAALKFERLSPLPQHADRRLAERYVKKGDDMMEAGNVAQARGFYTRAADLGWAPAALALATTHDPHELAAAEATRLVQSDPDQARALYREAGEIIAGQVAFYEMRLALPAATDPGASSAADRR